MKRHAKLFPFSFLLYFLIYCTSPSIFSWIGDYGVALALAIIFLYQILYIVIFRKKLQISFCRALASFFLWLTVMIEVCVVYSYIFSLLINSEIFFYNLLAIPLLCICHIYQLAYFMYINKIR